MHSDRKACSSPPGAAALPWQLPPGPSLTGLPGCSVSTLFAQYVAGHVGRSAEHRGKNAERAAVGSMAELHALLDEWIVAVFTDQRTKSLP